MELLELKNKTIKNISGYYYDGCLIEFTDGTIISLTTTEYPGGGYRDTHIEKIKLTKDIREILNEED